MNEFTHIDIFATKGIEYLIVIVFLFSIYPFWRYLNSPGKLITVPTASAFVSVIDRIKASIPKGVFLDPTHSWAFLEPSGTARVGADSFLLSATGPVNYQNLRNANEIIKRGDIMGRLEQDGKSINIYSPISGIIKNRNLMVTESSETDNHYEQGWMYRIIPEDWTRDVTKLMFARQAGDWIQNEFARLRDFFAFSSHKYGMNAEKLVLQDGGAVADGALRHMPEEIWDEFQAEFIDSQKSA